MVERAPLLLPPERGASRATAYVRPKTTPRRVVLVDRFADWAISIGGLAVILAVFGIMAFLFQVVVPLFGAATVEAEHRYAVPASVTPGRPLALVTDEYDTVGLELSAAGLVRTFHLPTGRALAENALSLGPAEVTAFGRVAWGERFAAGALRQATAIRIDGRRVWNERAMLEAGDRLFASRLGFDGRSVTGTLLAAGAPVPDAARERCRELAAGVTDGDCAGVSRLPEVFVARYLGRSAERCRRLFAAIWAVLRPPMLGREARAPRIWNT